MLLKRRWERSMDTMKERNKRYLEERQQKYLEEHPEERERIEKELAEIEAQERREAERVLESARYDLESAREEDVSARQECARLEGAVAQAELLRTTAEDALDALDEEERTSAQRKREIRERTEALEAASREAETERLPAADPLEDASSGVGVVSPDGNRPDRPERACAGRRA